MPDEADVILQSSDLVNFRVHRPILAASSPFFKDLFSLPQPPEPDHEVDGLPVVQLSEDAEVLNSLVTMLYPVPPEIPDSVDHILTLLSACQKYDMTTVQSSIRAEVGRRGLLSQTGAGSFRLFAAACRKRLIPEMKAAARLTLGYPMTFEYLGEALKSFEGWALSDLASFRRLCSFRVSSCFETISNSRSEPSTIWLGCPTALRSERRLLNEGEDGSLPIWLDDIFKAKIVKRLNTFASPLVTPSNFREEYLKTLRGHVREKDCTFCMKTHILKGEEFCAEVESELEEAWDVQYSFSIELPADAGSPSPLFVRTRCFSLGLAANLSPSN
ncbi:hypothetical protein EI94DRAFT_1155013 [Lactarius quietus]|nr:hypothetical protein EI94DRAFT_1155013 [Lactarius quietus]